MNKFKIVQKKFSELHRFKKLLLSKVFHKKMVIVLILLLMVTGYLIMNQYKPFRINKSAVYYRQQIEYYVEPFEIIKGLENAILFDVRSFETYEKAHIIDSRHLKVDVDLKTGKILNEDEIISSVKKMKNRNDLIILYGENEYSPLPSQVAALLSEQGLEVKLLSVGWNEFRHFSTFWLPENLNGRVNIIDYLEGEEVVSTN